MRYHFTSQGQLALNNAKRFAKELNNSTIGTEHLLLGILEVKEGRLARLLAHKRVTSESIRIEITSLFGFSQECHAREEYTCTMEEILQECITKALTNEKKMVDLDCLTYCLLKAQNNVACELLRRNGVDVEEIMTEFSVSELDALGQFKELRNLNETALQQVSPIVKREKELNELMNTLCRKSKANPLLVGEAGVGKSALVEELAHRILLKQVPIELQSCIIFELSLNHLVAGTKYRGEFEEKIQKLLDKLLQFPNVILFIDEIHMMINAGKAEGSIDVAGVLKPYLARGLIRCIGATTLDEYNQTIQQDRALKRRFQCIRIDEPNQEDALKMLECKRAEYEHYHHVHFPDYLINCCFQLARQYLPELTFPDKAIDVLDLSCVIAKRENQKEVDQHCLMVAIESLSQIPLSLRKKVEKNRELRELMPLPTWQSFLDRLDFIDKKMKKEEPKDIWILKSLHQEDKREFISKVTEAILNHEKEAIYLDGEVCTPQTFFMLSTHLKKNPFQMIIIENYDQLSLICQYHFNQIFIRGFTQVEQETIHCDFCIFVVDAQEKKTGLGFHNPIKESTLNKGFIIELRKSG